MQLLNDWPCAEKNFVAALEALGIYLSTWPTNGRRAAGFHGPIEVSEFCSDRCEGVRLAAAIIRLVRRLLDKIEGAGANACLGFSMDVDPWAEDSGTTGLLLTATATAVSLQRG